MKGHEENEKENGERWLLTYADLITLLLAFFIIMFSISNLNMEKYKSVIESLGSAFGAVKPSASAAPGAGTGGDINFPLFTPSSSVLPSSLSTSPSPSPGASSLASPTPGSGIGNAIEVEKMNNVKNQVEGMLKKNNLQTDVSVTIRARGLVISINSRVLFASGSASLTVGSVQLVQKIADILTPLASNQIEVEGHTDNDPISTSEFPSNWELSSARANTVLRLLLQNTNLKPENLSAVGYGEFRPIAPNDTPENKAKNRRVNIVILKDDYSQSIDVNNQD